jgi:uncharacterized protein (TIGR02271 family)
MAVGQIRRAVGVFPTHQEAEQALVELRDSGFSMDRVSVVAKDSTNRGDIAGAEMHDRVGNKADEGAKTGAATGGTIGGLTGLLVGLGALAIPGIGPIMLAGAGATALATTLAGAGIGAVAGGLLGGLVGLGIPEDRAKVYNDRVSRGEYLVMVEGTDEELHRVHSILNRRGIQEWGIYDMPQNSTNRMGAVDASTVDTSRVDASGVDTVRPIDRSVSSANPTAASTGFVDNSVDRVVGDRPSAIPAQDDEAIRLYEERLLVDKTRQKSGEVVLGKHVETETARISVPVEKERIVVERVNADEIGRPVTPGEADFQDGEVVRMEVYEETADVQKEAFVREEVNLRKEVSREVVDVEETTRREELDVNVQGNPVVDNRGDRRPNDRI